MNMETKLSKLKKAYYEGDYRTAIKIAAKFPRLSKHKGAIQKAWEAYARPDFQRQIGRDVDKLKEEGKAALIELYDL